ILRCGAQTVRGGVSVHKRKQVRWSWLAAFASLAVVLTGATATSASAAKSAQGDCGTSAKNQLQKQTNAHGAPCGSAQWVDVAPLPQTLFGPATTTDGTYVYAF